MSTNRQVLGHMVQLLRYFGMPYSPLPKTTLNEHFGVLSGVTPPPGSTPLGGWIAIGNKGHEFFIANDVQASRPRDRKSSWTALLGHIPFIARPVASDLSDADRTKYAMRVVKSINSVDYAFYYLRRLDLTGLAPKVVERTVTNGTISERAYTFTDDDLNPTPVDLGAAGANILRAQSLSAVVEVPVTLTADDLKEIMDACVLLFGTAAVAVISEVAAVAGIPRAVQLPDGTTFNELSCATITHVLPRDKFIRRGDGTYSFDLKFGSGDPVLVINSVDGQ